MFKLEKVFQNDDRLLINLYFFFNTLFIFLSTYLFSIIENHSLYYFFEYSYFTQSNYYEFNFLNSIIFFLLFFFVNQNKLFKINKLYFFKTVFIYLMISYSLSLILIFYFIEDFYFTINFIYLLFTIFIFLMFNKFIFNIFLNYLIDSNIIQRNILLLGDKNSILKIFFSKNNSINIYKCCLLNVTDLEYTKLKNEIKIPIFKFSDDPRLILEYHEIGQIWILDNGNQEELNKNLKKIIQFPIDIFQIKTFKEHPYNENLINGIYQFKEFSKSNFYGIRFFIKILIDKILSIIFILISLPIITLSCLMIYLEDGFPLFFSQERTGWDGRRFTVYKLRSMKVLKERNFIFHQVQEGDTSLLNIGKFIRKFSIDELPQFLNVLKGDMSIVGPRPHTVQMDIHYFENENYMKRYKTLPGITGWAQVNGLRGATPTDDLIKKRMEYDLWYLNNWTILLDFYIIIKTFYAVFKFKGK